MPRFQSYAIFLTLISVAWAVLVGLVPPMAAGLRVAEDFRGIPVVAGEWERDGDRDGKFDDLTYGALPTCSLITRDYRDEGGRGSNVVNLSIVYGLNLGDFHQPEICMKGSGWREVRKRGVWLRPKGGRPHKASVVTMTNDGELYDLVMIYWFYMGGEVIPSMKKAGVMLNALRGRRVEPSAMVKFSAPVFTDEETALRSAMKLSEELTPRILEVVRRPVRYVPSGQALQGEEG